MESIQTAITTDERKMKISHERPCFTRALQLVQNSYLEKIISTSICSKVKSLRATN